MLDAVWRSDNCKVYSNKLYDILDGHRKIILLAHSEKTKIMYAGRSKLGDTTNRSEKKAERVLSEVFFTSLYFSIEKIVDRRQRGESQT